MYRYIQIPAITYGLVSADGHIIARPGNPEPHRPLPFPLTAIRSPDHGPEPAGQVYKLTISSQGITAHAAIDIHTPIGADLARALHNQGNPHQSLPAGFDLSDVTGCTYYSAMPTAPSLNPYGPSLSVLSHWRLATIIVYLYEAELGFPNRARYDYAPHVAEHHRTITEPKALPGP